MPKGIGYPSKEKSKEMLMHEEVHGKPLSEKQRGLLGLIAGGGHPKSKRMKQAEALKRKIK